MQSEYTRALADYRVGRTAIDMIQAIEDLPDGPVFDGANDALCELERALAEAQSTPDEMREKLSVLFDEFELGHVDLELLHVALDAYRAQREAEGLARLMAQQAA